MRDFPAIKIVVLLAVLFVVTTAAFGIEHIETSSFASNVIVPQVRGRGFCLPRHQPAIEITDIQVKIDILENAATTTIEINLKNNTNRRQEAELIYPVPDGAVIRGFAYDGPGHMVSAKLLDKEEARRIYQRLVSQIRDPALTEFIGYNLIRSSVFPVEAHGKQKIRFTYEHLLDRDMNRVDYVLPRSQSLSYAVPWKVEATIKARQPISTVYSPSHKVYTHRESENEISVKIDSKAEQKNGPFRLSYLLEKDHVTATMFAYPDKRLRGVEGGYFLLVAGLPADITKRDDKVKRDVTIVIDRSGSMRGEKLAQAKEAAMQIVSALNDGEAFNIIIYSNTVETFSLSSVIKNRSSEERAHKYIQAITASGGTNIYDAMQKALSHMPKRDMLGIVLFLTDGLPTVGRTSELDIRKLASDSNPHNRRVFTFGLGFDVNAPLLERIAELSRAKAEFVLPKEDVEVKVGRVFAQLTGPVVTDPVLVVLDADGKPAAGRTTDIMPVKLPDLYENDELVLTGRYIGNEPVKFRIEGKYLGDKKAFEFTFKFNRASKKNGFVARFWASRRIAELIDIIRQKGIEPGTRPNDPKIKEIVEEIVTLSKEFGILTEYTAFLAREGVDLSDDKVLFGGAMDNLSTRAIETRSGIGATNQAFNFEAMKQSQIADYDNNYFDENLNRVRITNVQSVNRDAYFNKGKTWYDSRLAGTKKSELKADRIIIFADAEYFKLAEKLAAEDRQASLALEGDIWLVFEGETVLIKTND